jgi:hypothetical protein
MHVSVKKNKAISTQDLQTKKMKEETHHKSSLDILLINIAILID